MRGPKGWTEEGRIRLDSLCVARRSSFGKNNYAEACLLSLPLDPDYGLNAGRTRDARALQLQLHLRPVLRDRASRRPRLGGGSRVIEARGTRDVGRQDRDRVRDRVRAIPPVPRRRADERASLSVACSTHCHLSTSIIGRPSAVTVVISRPRRSGNRTSRNLIINASPSVRFRRSRVFRSG